MATVRGFAPDQHPLASVFRRLGQRDDPWAGLRELAQPLDDAVARLADLD